MAKEAFYSVKIAGRTFEAILTAEGPVLEMQHSRTDRTSVPLGSAMIAEAFGDRTVKSLWICEGDASQPRICLSRFTAEDIYGLIGGFGLEGDGLRRKASFYSSAAWEGLKEYVARHPKKAAAFATSSSHGAEWFEKAAAGNSGDSPVIGMGR